MATWSRRYPGGPVQVFKKKTKEKPAQRVPRKLYTHLDGQDDSVVDAWVRDYEVKFEGKRVTPDHLIIGDLKELVEQYMIYLKVSRKLAKATLNYHRLSLTTYALPFFLDRPTPLREPGQWPGVSVHLLDHLVKEGLKTDLIRKINAHLRGFWTWLEDEGLVHTPLRLRRPTSESKGTPLKYTLAPEECLEAAKKLAPDLRLFCLLGYFFSLRPQETYALDKSRFKLGTEATFLDCAKAMKRAGLYTRLAVHLNKQRRIYNEKPDEINLVDLKTAASLGYVSCFNEEAAKLFVETTKAFGGAPWFPYGYTFYRDRWQQEWPKTDGKQYTFKDLRRASLYWLGHFSKLTPIELQKHARHAKFETTSLYLRRPAEEHEESPAWDLDA